MATDQLETHRIMARELEANLDRLPHSGDVTPGHNPDWHDHHRKLTRLIRFILDNWPTEPRP